MNYDYNKLRQELINDEGLRLTTYTDTLGNKTIGIGHLQENQNLIQTISMQECDNLFQSDVNTAVTRLLAIFPEADTLDDTRKRALINMTFNLGERLAQFVKFLGYLKQKNYVLASQEMLNSLWAKQVGDRAVRLSNMIKDGDGESCPAPSPPAPTAIPAPSPDTQYVNAVKTRNNVLALLIAAITSLSRPSCQSDSNEAVQQPHPGAATISESSHLPAIAAPESNQSHVAHLHSSNPMNTRANTR